jgi:cytochrome c-type biogenesis protein CcmH
LAQTNDAALDRRVQHVTEELRCLVCQNQTIADSHAELAVMLKRQVRDMLARGATDREAVDFMVQRYGEFVLYRPPLKAATWLLWFGPFGLLLAGLALLFARLRARQHDPEPDAPDAPDEELPA